MEAPFSGSWHVADLEGVANSPWFRGMLLGMDGFRDARVSYDWDMDNELAKHYFLLSHPSWVNFKTWWRGVCADYSPAWGLFSGRRAYR